MEKINFGEYWSPEYEFICNSIAKSSVEELNENLRYLLQTYRENSKLNKINIQKKSLFLSQDSIFYELTRNRLEELGVETFFPKRLEVLLN